MAKDGEKRTAHSEEWKLHQIWQVIFDVSPILEHLPRPWAIVEDQQFIPEYCEHGWRYFEGSMILVSVSGAGFVDIDGERTMLTPGTALLLNRSDPRLTYGYPPGYTEPWRFFFFYMRRGSEAMVDAITAQYGHLFHVGLECELLAVLKSYRGNIKNDIKVITPLAGAELCMRLLSLLTSDCESEYYKTPQRILAEKVKHIISFNIAHRHTKKEIAARCGVSVSHMERVFRRETGMTIKRYTDEKKILAAQQMLKMTYISCKEVAEHFKIEPGSTFYRLFKKITGTSPRGE